jgi:bla regulator protein blaR1
MISWIVYAICTGALIGGAAALLDGMSAILQARRRMLWVAAIVLSVSIGVGVPALDTRTEATRQLPRSAEGLLHVDAVVSGTEGQNNRGDRALATAWVLSSLLVLGCLIVAGVRLAALRRANPTRFIAGFRLSVGGSVGPAVAGVIAPVILLPSWMRELKRGERRLIVAHEIEHVRAADQALWFLASVAIMLMPWNVALWWQVRRLRLAIEYDCDRRVLRRHPSVRDYSGTLISSAMLRLTRDGSSLGLGGMTMLERRITQMTKPNHRRGGGTLVFRVLAASFIAAAMLLERPSPPRLFLGASIAPLPSVASAHHRYGSVAGHVVDTDGRDAGGVRVSVRGSAVYTFSNSSGRFLFMAIAPGRHTLVFSGDGSHDKVVEGVIVDDGRTTQLRVVLSAD